MKKRKFICQLANGAQCLEVETEANGKKQFTYLTMGGLPYDRRIDYDKAGRAVASRRLREIMLNPTAPVNPAKVDPSAVSDTGAKAPGAAEGALPKASDPSPGAPKAKTVDILDADDLDEPVKDGKPEALTATVKVGGKKVAEIAAPVPDGTGSDDVTVETSVESSGPAPFSPDNGHFTEEQPDTAPEKPKAKKKATRRSGPKRKK
jgi:hypothetical protein